MVRVNDTPTSNLKHSLAQEVILGCGNSFVMALLRPVDEGDDAQLAGSRSAVSVEFEQISAECQQMPPTPDSMVYSDMSEVTINTVSSTRSNSREDGVEEPKQHQVHQPLFDARMQVEQPLFHPRMQVIEKRETDIIDDHIAELLSGEAEVLKEHNVIGYVNSIEMLIHSLHYVGQYCYKTFNIRLGQGELFVYSIITKNIFFITVR